MKFYNLFSLILGVPKTLYFNFKYFKFKDAIKLPVLLSNRVKIIALKGNVIIKAPLHTGLIRIGVKGAGTCCWHKSILEMRGTLIFNGRAVFGDGSSISISTNAILTIGDNFTTTGDTALYCKKNITIGDNCLFSWDSLIMDSDVHQIKDKDNKCINGDQDIYIGNNVWMGCRCTILKGTRVNNYTVIAANSCIHNTFDKENVIVGGNPPRTLNENITWEI